MHRTPGRQRYWAADSGRETTLGRAAVAVAVAIFCGRAEHDDDALLSECTQY